MYGYGESEDMYWCNYDNSFGKENKFCRYYFRGHCRDGEYCGYSHDPSLVPACRFYAKHGCRYGDKCWFRHDKPKQKDIRERFNIENFQEADKERQEKQFKEWKEQAEKKKKEELRRYSASPYSQPLFDDSFKELEFSEAMEKLKQFRTEHFPLNCKKGDLRWVEERLKKEILEITEECLGRSVTEEEGGAMMIEIKNSPKLSPIPQNNDAKMEESLTKEEKVEAKEIVESETVDEKDGRIGEGISVKEMIDEFEKITVDKTEVVSKFDRNNNVENGEDVKDETDVTDEARTQCVKVEDIKKIVVGKLHDIREGMKEEVVGEEKVEEEKSEEIFIKGSEIKKEVEDIDEDVKQAEVDKEREINNNEIKDDKEEIKVQEKSDVKDDKELCKVQDISGVEKDIEVKEESAIKEDKEDGELENEEDELEEGEIRDEEDKKTSEPKSPSFVNEVDREIVQANILAFRFKLEDLFEHKFISNWSTAEIREFFNEARKGEFPWPELMTLLFNAYRPTARAWAEIFLEFLYDELEEEDHAGLDIIDEHSGLSAEALTLVETLTMWMQESDVNELHTCGLLAGLMYLDSDKWDLHKLAHIAEYMSGSQPMNTGPDLNKSRAFSIVGFGKCVSYETMCVFANYLLKACGREEDKTDAKCKCKSFECRCPVQYELDWEDGGMIISCVCQHMRFDTLEEKHRFFVRVSRRLWVAPIMATVYENYIDPRNDNPLLGCDPIPMTMEEINHFLHDELAECNLEYYAENMKKRSKYKKRRTSDMEEELQEEMRRKASLMSDASSRDSDTLSEDEYSIREEENTPVKPKHKECKNFCQKCGACCEDEKENSMHECVKIRKLTEATSPTEKGKKEVSAKIKVKEDGAKSKENEDARKRKGKDDAKRNGKEEAEKKTQKEDPKKKDEEVKKKAKEEALKKRGGKKKRVSFSEDSFVQDASECDFYDQYNDYLEEMSDNERARILNKDPLLKKVRRKDSASESETSSLAERSGDSTDFYDQYDDYLASDAGEVDKEERAKAQAKQKRCEEEREEKVVNEKDEDDDEPVYQVVDEVTEEEEEEVVEEEVVVGQEVEIAGGEQEDLAKKRKDADDTKKCQGKPLAGRPCTNCPKKDCVQGMCRRCCSHTASHCEPHEEPRNILEALERLVTPGCHDKWDDSMDYYTIVPSKHFDKRDDFEAFMAKGTPALRRVSFGPNFGIRDEHVIKVAETFNKQLQVLEIGSSETGEGSYLTDASVAAITRCCPSLVKLKLESCTDIHDEAVCDVWETCQQLKHLQISGHDKQSGKVTKNSLRPLFDNHNAPKLRFICLNDQSVGDDVIARLKRARPGLSVVAGSTAEDYYANMIMYNAMGLESYDGIFYW